MNNDTVLGLPRKGDILNCGCIYLGVPQGHIGTGYGYDPETGETACYGHAAERERENMVGADSAFGYLTRDARNRRVISTWPGAVWGVLGRVVQYGESRAARKVYVTVKGSDGRMWYGTGPLDSGDYVRLRPYKSQ